MGAFCKLVFSLMLILTLIYAANTEYIRQNIFEEGIGRCHFYQFKCGNNKCILRSYYCNGRNDCGDNSDELYCSLSGSKCPTNDFFSCRKPNNYYMCLNKSRKCDGYNDCYYGEDEVNC
ncbi:uncharacterized protein CDAR_373861, partial [Caerostris darwini]